MSISQLLKERPPPDPLPLGWILRESRSQPGTYFYYNQETGEAQWEEPKLLVIEQQLIQDVVETFTQQEQQQQQQQQEEKETILRETIKRTAPESTATTTTTTTTTTSSSSKRMKQQQSTLPLPKEVRVLHILKKHKDSRRPSSWRQPKGTPIRITKEEARQELSEILTILKESSNTLEELRATMEELARTESDCSSAKRGGDLGYFGRKKMQPEFEKASFALAVGELSDIVDTSSGVHIILRIG
jgi:peptidyl-prolyl cis-trans isomerase NIMA-interacting 1